MAREVSEHFMAQKMIVVVRNPIDVIPSFGYLTQLKSHDLVSIE